MKDSKSEQILAKIKQLIKEEGQFNLRTPEDTHTLINEFALPALANSKDVQTELYKDFIFAGGNTTRKAKNLILQKLGNVTRNVVERAFMKQQKYNNNIYTIISYLVEENNKLREKITKLEKQK